MLWRKYKWFLFISYLTCHRIKNDKEDETQESESIDNGKKSEEAIKKKVNQIS